MARLCAEIKKYFLEKVPYRAYVNGIVLEGQSIEIESAKYPEICPD